MRDRRPTVPPALPRDGQRPRVPRLRPVQPPPVGPSWRDTALTVALVAALIALLIGAWALDRLGVSP